MDSASNILPHSIINYLSCQLRRQSVANAHQVLSGRLGEFSESRYINTHRADRNLCQFVGVPACHGRGKREKIEAEELG